MAAHPEVQKRAQAELDAVVGPNRLPEFEDQDSLPYICALTKELLRWRTVVPLSIPHRSMQDDEYRGYLIPKGSLVFSNLWSVGLRCALGLAVTHMVCQGVLPRPRSLPGP